MSSPELTRQIEGGSIEREAQRLQLQLRQVFKFGQPSSGSTPIGQLPIGRYQSCILSFLPVDRHSYLLIEVRYT
ncbi:unnamed protein product [Nezara viridula]|uniref:Uncharacterized protein n=1 Tax=Nezara viridula TaxID=85310 RepID=A0A9P0EET1_NEZVI|nr:unnamed protein product [Nezara viridula]